MASIVRSVVNWGSHAKPPIPNQNDMCEICGKKPKFVENGRTHPYCSRTCARNEGATPTACALSSCRATGKAAFAGFCSETHGREAVRIGQVKGCNQCNMQPPTMGELCLACARRSRAQPASMGPRIRELNPNSTTFKNVRETVSFEWESSSGPPMIHKVYEIIVPRDVRARQDAFRKTISSIASVSEIQTFHSSQCICDLGVKDAALCKFPSCGICRIVKTSFKELAFGERYNTGRWGDGIYSYKDPSLADRFATSCTSSPYRVMIMCDVVTQSEAKSKVAEEPVFVEDPDAIIPVYIIMYTK